VSDIIVEYSGWIRLSPQNIRFEYIGQNDMPLTIDGVQWQALSEDEQGDYILEDEIAISMAASCDGNSRYRTIAMVGSDHGQTGMGRFECRSSGGFVRIK